MSAVLRRRSCALVGFVLAATAARAVTDGTYVGTTSQGQQIEIEVEDGKIKGWSLGWSCGSGAGTVAVSTTCTPGASSFSCGAASCIPFAASSSISGTFSGNTVSGSATVKHQPDLSSGCCTTTPTFTAELEGGSPTCTPSATALCLEGGRFRVSARYATRQGLSGDAQVVSLTDQTGYLWFFDAANVEAVVKVLDGCGTNDRYWVFAAGLTNVEVTLTVTDTQNPTQVRTYVNPQRTPFQPIQDTSAFATCP